MKTDLWNFLGKVDAICITTNGIVKSNKGLVMGAGCAKEAAERFPDLPKIFGRHVLLYGNTICVHNENELKTALVSFPTKEDWKDPSSLDLIIRSSMSLVRITDEKGWERVVLPMPGVGFGQLDFKLVSEAIQPLFDNRFVVVFK